MNRFIGTLLFLTFFGGSAAAQELPQLGKNTPDEIIKAMTLEEKAAMAAGIGYLNWRVPYMLTPGAAGTTYEMPKFGIKPSVFTDGPAGVHINIDSYGDKKVYCTAFPIGSALASSWNEEILRKVGTAMANEVLENNMDVLLAPAMNIHRNPLCGRNFEYYSEDPLLSGKMGAAFVRGTQSLGVGTSVKHFVANNQESNRMKYNAVISQRALREIYLRGFEIAIKEGEPWTVMTTYNRLNGHYTSEEPALCIDILRGEWGYDGMVVTDWSAGADPIAQVRAGNEMIMPGNMNENGPGPVEAIVAAVRNKQLDEALLDRNVKRVLEFLVKTPRFKGYQPSGEPDFERNAAICREAGSESMVLLKNDGALPIAKKVKNVALFGKSSYSTIVGGTGSGAVNYKTMTNLTEGLRDAGYKLYAPLEDTYGAYIEKAKQEWVETEWYKPREHSVTYAAEFCPDDAQIKDAAKKSDIAIVTIGRCSGEGWDRSVEEFIELSQQEKDLIEKVTEAFHSANKKVVVVLNITGVIETVSWRDKADAILISWLPGQEAGHSITDVLTGKVNPSGKLAMSYPVKYADVPSAATFPGEPAHDPVNSFQSEGVYVGYRYYNSFDVPTAYEFGYGLSYTDFAYSDIEVSSPQFDGRTEVSFTVTNTGKKAGKEVAQLYVSAPAGEIDKPAAELKAFAKTRLLKPRESQRITLELDGKLIASFWEGKSAWIADKGEYQVMVGASSKDLRLTDNFFVPETIVVEEVNDVLYPNFPIKDLRNTDR